MVYNIVMSKSLVRHLNFMSLLSAQKPDNIAISYDEDGIFTSLTYNELIERIENYPIKDKNSIGILAENNLETVLAIFAYTKAKKQIVLLNPMDGVTTLKKQIQATDVDYLVGRREQVSTLQEYVKDNDIKPNGNIIFFTSGTSYTYKGVVLNEKSLCASAYNGGYLLPLKEKDVLLSILPLSHVFGFVCSLLWGLSFGCTVALGRGLRHLLDDGEYFKATTIALVPQIASFMAQNSIFNKELKTVLIGAGPCPKETMSIFKNSGIRVAFGYGLTETSSGVALAIGNDPEAMTVCPEDEIKIDDDGEILIHSPTCLMQGYYNDEKGTKEVVIDGYLHTGDLGKFDPDGLLHITGRKKDVFVLSDGTKIYCPDYEAALAKLLPGTDSTIVLINDKIILFVYDEKHLVDIELKVKRFNLYRPRNQRIAKIKMLDHKLPRTQTGKIKRWVLEEQAGGKI